MEHVNINLIINKKISVTDNHNSVWNGAHSDSLVNLD